MLTGAKRRARDLGQQAAGRVAERAGGEGRADDGGVGPRRAGRVAAQRRARGGGRAARRAVDLAVGEDRHVALGARAQRLMDHRPVDPRQALVLRMAGDLGGVQSALDRAAGGDEPGQAVGPDGEAEPVGRHEPVQRPPVGPAGAPGAPRAVPGGGPARRRTRPPRKPRRAGGAPAGTSRATTNAGTLRNATPATAPAAIVTRATTRPDGTSMVTSTSPPSGAATRPLSTAQAPRAIVP